jgi:hypothetical protein
MQPSSTRVFVSHSHTDNDYCRAFVNALNASGLDVWYDEHNLGWGALRQVIERELQSREHFVAILSPTAVASDWVNAEIDAALFLLGKGRLKTLLFVTAARCEVPLLLQRYKRLERPDGGGYTLGHAAVRAMTAMGLAPTTPASSSSPSMARAAQKPPPWLAPQSSRSPNITGYAIVIRQGKEPGRIYPLTKEGTTIGRSRESDIFLEDLAVARYHATLTRDWRGYVIRDEGSANGTYVNNQRITEQLLVAGDEIQVGQSVLAFVQHGQAPNVDDGNGRNIFRIFKN